MTERERLIELINKSNVSFENFPVGNAGDKARIELADYLIENGVTIKACETCEYIRTHKMRDGSGIELIGKSLKYCPECGKKIE